MIQQRWAFRTVAGDDVVVSRPGSLWAHRANGDHIRIVAGSFDRRVTLLAEAVVATHVAGRCDNHDSSLPRRLSCLAERIQAVRLEYRTSERQVDHADVVLSLQLDRATDSRNHSAIGAAAIGVEHSQVDDVGIGRHAVEASG